VSKTTITAITDRVVAGLAEWQARPLDPVYPVVLIDAIHVKIRDGQVANRAIYLALAVTVDDTREILGMWAGDGAEGAKIESVNARLRRAVRARGHFPSDAAALKCLYLALTALDPTGTAKARWSKRWKPALNAFEIAFEGRLIRTTH
jgi:transposase-like protein